jgi:hypothetical protein
VKATVQFSDEKVSSEEMLRTLNDSTFVRKPEMIRALVPACVSLQIPVKMGMKLVAQTAALFWSVDHVFCNFEVGKIPPPQKKKENTSFPGPLSHPQVFAACCYRFLLLRRVLIGSAIFISMVTEY